AAAAVRLAGARARDRVDVVALLIARQRLGVADAVADVAVEPEARRAGNALLADAVAVARARLVLRALLVAGAVADPGAGHRVAAVTRRRLRRAAIGRTLAAAVPGVAHGRRQARRRTGVHGRRLHVDPIAVGHREL